MASPHDIADELRALIAEARKVISESHAACKSLTAERKVIERLISTNPESRIESTVNALLKELGDYVNLQLDVYDTELKARQTKAEADFTARFTELLHRAAVSVEAIEIAERIHGIR